MIEMKEIVMCRECSLCAKDHGAGFVPIIKYICSRDDEEVDVDDGCTRGVFGEPMFVQRDADVIDLGDDAAVGRYVEEE